MGSKEDLVLSETDIYLWQAFSAEITRVEPKNENNKLEFSNIYLTGIIESEGDGQRADYYSKKSV